jgi:hypothetical protein
VVTKAVITVEASNRAAALLMARLQAVNSPADPSTTKNQATTRNLVEASSTAAHSRVQVITDKCLAATKSAALMVTIKVNTSQTTAAPTIPTTAAATSINRARKAPTRLRTSTSQGHQVIYVNQTHFSLPNPFCN